MALRSILLPAAPRKFSLHLVAPTIFFSSPLTMRADWILLIR